MGPNGMGNNICLMASDDYKVISVDHDNLSINSGLTIFFCLLSNDLLLIGFTIEWLIVERLTIEYFTVDWAHYQVAYFLIGLLSSGLLPNGGEVIRKDIPLLSLCFNF